MEKATSNTTKVVIKWALIYVVTAIVVIFLYQFSNLSLNSPVRYLSNIPFIAFLLLAQKEFKEQQGGYIKFGEAFSAGFKYALFAGLILAVFMYIYVGFVNPELLAKSVEEQRDKMMEKNGLSSEQVDTAIEVSKKYGAIIASVSQVIGSAIFGVIISLIGAAIFKKERSAFDMEEASPEA